MKFRNLVGVVAGMALCTTVAAAQVCQGDLSFRNSSTHVGASLGLSDNSTSFGGGLSFGHAKGWFGGGSLGMSTFDNVDGHALAVGGGIGYIMPQAKGQAWQMCPGATLSLGFGPNFDVGGNSTHFSSQTAALGVSMGTVYPMSKKVNLLPFGSASFAHTRAAVKVNGASTSGSDSYLLLGFGAGFQLSPSLVVRPAMSLAAGSEAADDTFFSLGITWALRH
jgi:subtilisin family serine protease